MNKFSFGNFDSTQDAEVFTSNKGYSEPSGEIPVRKQFSFPLSEIKTFINKIVPIKTVDSDDKAIQLKVTDSGLIQYSLDGETWVDTASGGHYIYDEDETQLAQKTKLMFKNTTVYNSGDYTVVQGIQGSQGVSVASMVQVEQSSSSGGNNKWRATLSNGTTYDFIVKNGLQGEQGATGPQGNGLVILGTYASLEDLQAAHPVGNEGDIYSVGTSSEANPNYVWDTDDEAWESIGKTRGEKGAKGDTGEQGATGNGIQSIVVTESSVSGGNNLVTITMTGGQVYTFNVKNGEQGQAGTGIPTGGTQGQHLAKKTSLDYDLEWVDTPTVDQTYDATSTNAQSGVAVASAISTKQDALVSGTNIKTINGHSLLASGDLRDVGIRRTRNNITSNLSNLCTAIAEQNLEKYGYAIGDYFVGASGYYYHLADMDTYYGGYGSYAVVGTHHCGIVVDTKSTSQWYTSNSSVTYTSSTLHSFLSGTALTNIKSDLTSLFGDWSSHLLSHSLLSANIGTWGWTDGQYISALTEVQVYGSRVWSGDNYQQGEGVKKLTLFDKFRFNEIIGNTWWWLRSLSSSSSACCASRTGDATYNGLTDSSRAVGLILFK